MINTFNKLKVEKLAKSKETDIVASNLTDNRSVIRAIARFQAAKDLHPDAPEQERLDSLFESFYLEAKWQPAWEEPFKKSSAASLGEMLKIKLGTPAVRGRRKAEPVQPTVEPDSVDPEAILEPEPQAVTA